MKYEELTKEDYQLIQMGLDTLAKHFDDGVYHHTVGCAIRTKSNKVYTGVNCDGIHGSCAEYITMGSAISSGEREFDTIVAVHEKAPNGVISPCGNCRQMLLEYAKDILVIVNDENHQLKKVSIASLLPLAWHPVKIDEENE